MEGLSSALDRCDYPPASHVDVYYPTSDVVPLGWYTWYVGAITTVDTGVEQLQCKVVELYYVDCGEQHDVAYARLLSIDSPTTPLFHERLDTLDPPPPDELVPTYTATVVIGDDDLKSESTPPAEHKLQPAAFSPSSP